MTDGQWCTTHNKSSHNNLMLLQLCIWCPHIAFENTTAGSTTVLLSTSPCPLFLGQQSCQPKQDRWHIQCQTCQFHWLQVSCLDQAQDTPQCSHRFCRKTESILVLKVFQQYFILVVGQLEEVSLMTNRLPQLTAGFSFTHNT